MKPISQYFLVKITEEDFGKLKARGMEVRVGFLTSNIKMEDQYNKGGAEC